MNGSPNPNYPNRPRGRVGASVVQFKATVDPFRNILVVLMIITISRIHQHFPFLAPFRPALALVLLAVMYAYLNPKYLAIGSIFSTSNAKVIGAFAVMACVSVPFGISMGHAAGFIIEEYSKVLLFGFLVLLGIRHSRDLYKLIWGFVIAAGFLAYMSLFVFRLRTGRGDDFMRIQNAYTYDSNDLGFVAVLGLALTLLTLQVSKTKGKLLSLVILAALGMTIARTGSRGAFVTLLCVGGAMFILLRNVSLNKRLGIVAVAGLGLVVAAPPGYWAKMLTVLEPKQDYNWTSPTGRREVFKRGVGYMMRNPVTGIGIQNFARAEGLISDRAAAQKTDQSLAGIKWSAAHNSYLQAAAEMGIPGLVLFCVLIFGSVVQCLRIRKRMPKHWFRGDPEERFLYYTSVYLPVALIGFAVGCFFVSFAYLDPIYILAAFVAGLQASVDVKLKGNIAPTVQPGRPTRTGHRPKPLTGLAVPPPLPRLQGR